jgi:signal transduction histidine kinase
MDGAPPREADRARRTLWATVLVFRWAALAWLSVMALTAGRPFVRPELAWLSVGVALGWTAWLTVSRGEVRGPALWFDLGLSMALMLVSAVVVPEGQVEERQLFATAYPVSAALAWGVARGPWGGLAAGLVLGAAYAMTRPLNGLSLAELTGDQVQSIANGAVNFLLAGGAVGVASRLLDRSAVRADEATREAFEARERAARLAERESLVRTIHDSVLQILALISKRGRELAARPQVPGGEVRRLAEMAGRQERELRALILREPTEAPSGTASLREALEAAAREVTEVPVEVSAVGPLWLPAATVEEVGAAVRQALRNVADHASAGRATVFAEAQAEGGDDGGWAVVTVRDDGRGFDYDEGRLRAEGKAGILKSVKGRIEELGGTVRVHTSPGEGTEIELRLPLAATAEEASR